MFSRGCPIRPVILETLGFSLSPYATAHPAHCLRSPADYAPSRNTVASLALQFSSIRRRGHRGHLPFEGNSVNGTRFARRLRGNRNDRDTMPRTSPLELSVSIRNVIFFHSTRFEPTRSDRVRAPFHGSQRGAYLEVGAREIDANRSGLLVNAYDRPARCERTLQRIHRASSSVPGP